MSRPVFAWPKPPPGQMPLVESASKLKRNALNFLSTIRVGEEEAIKAREAAALLSPIEENRKEKAIVPLVPSHIDSGMGARMRGDVRAEYTRMNQLKFDKPHRLFLSWDRAYPNMVVSLVIPKEQQQPVRGQSAVKAKGQAVLPLPVDDNKKRTRRGHDEEGGDEEFTLSAGSLTGTRDNRGDSSSESEAGVISTTEDEGPGRSFAFLLRTQQPPPKPKRRKNQQSQSRVNRSPTLLASSLTSADGNNVQGESTDDALSPTIQRRRLGENDNEASDLAWDLEYSPALLDDSRIIQGRHRVVQNLPSTRVSILSYVKTKVLKQELNSVFREHHSELAHDLTLSMLRKVRKELLDRALSADLELCTVALAYVYFEKLVLKRVVFKHNRKLIAFACLVLAYKFNENGHEKLKALLAEIERVNNISPEEILRIEFAVLAHLRFNLMVSGKDYFEHFVRILRTVDISPGEYLGEKHEEVATMLNRLAIQGKVVGDINDTDEDEDSSDDERSSSSSGDSNDSSKDSPREVHLSRRPRVLEGSDMHDNRG